MEEQMLPPDLGRNVREFFWIRQSGAFERAGGEAACPHSSYTGYVGYAKIQS